MTHLTPETLDALNAAAGGTVEFHEPGALIEDVDGLPLAVGPTLTSSATLAAAIVTTTQLDQLGISLTEARVRWPRRHFIDTERNAS